VGCGFLLTQNTLNKHWVSWLFVTHSGYCNSKLLFEMRMNLSPDEWQAHQLLQKINECTVMDLCRDRNLGGMPLQSIESLRCSMYNNVQQTGKFHTKFVNKIRTSLNKYAKGLYDKSDKGAYDALNQALLPNGTVFCLYERVNSLLGHHSNYQTLFALQLTQLAGIRKKLQKKYYRPPENATDAVDADTAATDGYIFVIRTRASVSANEPVYKIGKTSQTFCTRMGGYGTGYETILVLPVEPGRLDDIVTSILGQARTQFKHRPDYGSDYFEGIRADLIKIVVNECTST
jgi:hypothetical protein